MVSYSASQKASAADRCQQAADAVATDDAETSDCWPFHVGGSTATGEQTFVQETDDAGVFASEAERAAADAEFFESVRRGDFHTINRDASPAADELRSSESKVAADLAALDVRTTSSDNGKVTMTTESSIDTCS